MSSTKYYYLGQAYNSENTHLELKLPVNNSAFLFGESLTTTFIVCANMALNLNDHYTRLQNSFNEFYGTGIPLDFSDLLLGLKAIFPDAKNVDSYFRVKVVIFLNPGLFPGHKEEEQWQWLIMAEETGVSRFENVHLQEIKVKSIYRESHDEISSILQEHKFGSYGKEMAIRRKIMREHKADDILWVKKNGVPIELSTSSIFGFNISRGDWFVPALKDVLLNGVMVQKFRSYLVEIGETIRSEYLPSDILLAMNSAQKYFLIKQKNVIDNEVRLKVEQFLNTFQEWNWNKNSVNIYEK